MALPRPTIRPATRDDLPALCDMLNTVFPTRVRTLEEITAKYTPPDGCRSVPPGYLAEADGAIVAFYGVMSWVVCRAGKLLNVMQPCDVAVVTSYRKSGLYLRLYNEYRKQRDVFGPVAFGFPGEQAASIGIAKMDYVMRAATVVMEYKGPQIENAAAPVGVGLQSFIPEAWFPYVTDTSARLGVTTHRTQAFYEWRFQNMTDRTHYFLTARRDGAVVGVAVLRYDPTATLDSPVILFDLLADDDDARQSLLHTVGVGLMPFARRPLYHGVTTNAPYLTQLESLGFTPVTNGVLVTSLLADEIGTPVPDDYAALHTTDSWFCTFTDTDK